jgi:hypothetical protein
MKRRQATASNPSVASGRKARVVDARQLTAVRGGDGLGITVTLPDPNPSIMTQQHNEALIRL